MTYDGAGRLASVDIADGRPRSTATHGEADTTRGKLQREFEIAYRTMSGPHKARTMSSGIQVGEDYLMKCAPNPIHQDNEPFSLRFGAVNLAHKYSLVSVDEFH